MGIEHTAKDPETRHRHCVELIWLDKLREIHDRRKTGLPMHSIILEVLWRSEQMAKGPVKDSDIVYQTGLTNRISVGHLVAFSSGAARVSLAQCFKSPVEPRQHQVSFEGVLSIPLVSVTGITVLNEAEVLRSAAD